LLGISSQKAVELQSRTWKTDDGHNRSIVEIKARRIQFLNKRGKFVDAEAANAEEEDNHIITDENDADYTEDSFDKFLSNEESDLMKDK